ncbi:hypothetical protein FA95DRAFT_1593631 [Auriscalpium vulgare]|uniref:Uncharacterized protein n=1 Tax=Auriscalpium vulgare TaxID=40419 RepID=A0ACB8S4G9_9AGAM|nr:hypothetical protein FA95DRAFT_1593631 [Auriscalpium vulgare]
MQTAVSFVDPSAMLLASSPPSSPVRLSIDLLQLIFEMCTAEEEGLPYGPIFPVVASHVCHEWRVIALNTPTLWTCITLADRPGSDFALSRACIERSQRCSLTVNADFMGASQDRIVCALGLIELAFDRVRRINARFETDAEAIALVIVAIQMCMPRLEHLHVERPTKVFTLLGNLPDTLPIPWSELSGGQLPSLTSLVLIGVPADWNRWPMTNLVDLTISCMPTDMRPSFAALAAIVRASAHTLESLTIEAGAPITDPASWTLGEVVALPRLRALKLGYMEAAESAIIKLFTFPALRSLQLRNMRTGILVEPLRNMVPPNEMPILEQLCSRASAMPNVSALTLIGVYFDSSHASAAQLLSSFPNVQSLALSECCDALVEALALPPRASPGQNPGALPPIVLPNLRSLVVCGMSITFPHVPLLRRFELARHRGLAPPVLKTVTMRNDFLKLTLFRRAAKAELIKYAENVVLDSDRRGGRYPEDVLWYPLPQAIPAVGVAQAMAIDVTA